MHVSRSTFGVVIFSKMFSFKQIIIRHTKKEETMTHIYTRGKMQALHVFERAQMLDLADEDFKATIKHIFKDLKKTMLKELRKGIITMSLHIENISKDIEMNFFFSKKE
uniref:Uncharacterized protein n=1 Tax=Sciurus vulgaris TaxID=55149 RepID=A0A8D2JL77_SCIVU